MNSIIPEMTEALKAEAIATPTGLAQWALDIIVDATKLTSGRTLEGIAVEAVSIVFHGESSDPYRALTWPVFQSPLALKSAVLDSPCPSDSLEAKMTSLHRANEYNGQTGTDAKIRDIVKAAAVKYPPLQLTYGYIGNCDLFGGRYDDRSFRVFTGLTDSKSRATVMFGGYSSTHLGAMLVDVEANLDKWCQKQIMRLGMGEIFRRWGEEMSA